MKRKHILYRDVADKIKEDIMSGHYPVGSFLPTETELEAAFNVSKITVRKAIELLAADEYVEKRSGRGTTVLSNRPYNKLSKGTTFSQLLEKTGKEYTKKNLDFNLVELAEDHPASAGLTLNEEQQKFLITPEISALKRVRRSYDLHGEVVEYTEGIYNTALHPYVIEFEA